jgi:hypothetical protein
MGNLTAWTWKPDTGPGPRGYATISLLQALSSGRARGEGCEKADSEEWVGGKEGERRWVCFFERLALLLHV